MGAKMRTAPQHNPAPTGTASAHGPRQNAAGAAGGGKKDSFEKVPGSHKAGAGDHLGVGHDGQKNFNSFGTLDI